MSHLEESYYMQLARLEVPRPEREFKFHPTRKWRADFAWPERFLLVEIEGGVYSRGRHTRGKGFETDMTKYNAATMAGYKLLRFSGGMVSSGEAAKKTKAFFDAWPPL
jgi:hypothetical protein